MTDRSKIWVWLTLILLAIAWAVLLAHASQNTKTIRHPTFQTRLAANPTYIPILAGCADYASANPYSCGANFKITLDLYDYRVCKQVEDRTCTEWYSPQELHYALNSLPGWHD